MQACVAGHLAIVLCVPAAKAAHARPFYHRCADWNLHKVIGADIHVTVRTCILVNTVDGSLDGATDHR